MANLMVLYLLVFIVHGVVAKQIDTLESINKTVVNVLDDYGKRRIGDNPFDVKQLYNRFLKSQEHLNEQKMHCALHTIFLPQNISDCKTNVSFPFNYCQGYCESSEQFITNKVEKIQTCEICMQTSIKKTEVIIECENKTTKTLHLTTIDDCVCFKSGF
jgi:hypothetical protein